MVRDNNIDAELPRTLDDGMGANTRIDTYDQLDTCFRRAFHRRKLYSIAIPQTMRDLEGTLTPGHLNCRFENHGRCRAIHVW